MLLTLGYSERQQKCWGWGECHPAVVNRHNFDCSICPTENPTTWTAEDLNFEVACEDEVGTVSFQLDNLLRPNGFSGRPLSWPIPLQVGEILENLSCQQLAFRKELFLT